MPSLYNQIAGRNLECREKSSRDLSWLHIAFFPLVQLNYVVAPCWSRG